ncbi:hypothetical protein SJI19_02985 [Acerihabitans sp. TG2]|uniref:hypothetical protein n=1 Tax=Acerihabitans sp. TG2 TaxID=3096008 RepID=UPI002B227551|nr:hypothetical protein [Acerihabitans sp. TG2]MEA9389526.1 hypothetical protein [Acerihabitans sp. TG2]
MTGIDKVAEQNNHYVIYIIPSFFWVEMAVIVICILGIVIHRLLKDEFVVVWNSAFGASQALKRMVEKFIDDVINSLNGVIVHRG